MGWLLAVVLGLSSVLGAGAEASAQPSSRASALRAAARHRHRARPGAVHLVAQRRSAKRAHHKARKGQRRPPERAVPAQRETNAPSDIAFVTLSTAAEGTAFYVDSRRIGTGSTVRQPLPPGYHQFQAVHPSGARWQKYLSFDAGDDRQLIIHW